MIYKTINFGKLEYYELLLLKNFLISYDYFINGINNKDVFMEIVDMIRLLESDLKSIVCFDKTLSSSDLSIIKSFASKIESENSSEAKLLKKLVG